MQYLEYIIVGSGISALITYQNKLNTKVLSHHISNKKLAYKRIYNFNEYKGIGGNSNVWGSYINIDELAQLYENKNFYNFIKNNKLFDITKVSKNIDFSDVGFLSNKNSNQIFRITKKMFDNNLENFNLSKIAILKDQIKLIGEKKNYIGSKINLCIGNLELLKILYKSNLIKANDIISFKDGKVKYKIYFGINKNKYNFSIPMSPNEIISKFIFSRSLRYNDNDFLRNLIIQEYNNESIEFKFRASEIINYKKKSFLSNIFNRFYRNYFFTDHVCNLRVNNIPIQKLINQYSENIIINSSGILKEYISGPISQNLIYNAYMNSL